MRNRPICTICLLLIVLQGIQLWMTSGQTLVKVPADSIFYHLTEEQVHVQGEVYQKADMSDYQILYLKNCSSSDRTKSYYDSKIIIYDKNNSNVSIGKTVSCRGTANIFENAKNPGNYNQRLHYGRKGIYGFILVEEIVQVSGNENWLKEKLYCLKRMWKNVLVDTLGDRQGNVLSAMLLAEKSGMDTEVKELYQRNGIGHVLAISGLHISFIGVGIYKMIRKMGFSYMSAGIIAISILTFYVGMVGISVSVQRAYVMLMIRLGADMSGRVYDPLTALAVSVILWGMQEPLYLTDVSFYMSYGAILGIIIVTPVLQKVIPYASIYGSIGVQVIVLPVTLWFFYEISIYSFVWNLIVIPMMSIVMSLGMFGSMMWLICKPLAKVMLLGCKWILCGFEFVGEVGSTLPVSRVVCGRPEVYAMIVYYVIVILGLRYLYHGRVKWKKGIVMSYITACILLGYHPKGELQITMLNVGQGDGIFVRGPSGQTYLIDGGSSDEKQVGRYCIEPYLKYEGVGKLDYVFLSHGDKDHCSGIEEMLQRQQFGIRIEHLVFPVNYQDDETLMKLTALAKKYDTKVLIMEKETKLKEKELIVKCIQPGKNESMQSGNEGSMVIEFDYKNFRMLCTGDVEGEGEKLLLKNICGKTYDVLKVSHHGSKNATTEAFLQEIRPKVALISAGKENRYGHPHPETIKRLKKAGCKVYSTQTNGAIILETDGYMIDFFHSSI